MRDRPPTLGKRSFPTVGGGRTKEGQPRETAARRGYNHIWSKLSARFRRKHPFCRFCEQQGFEARLADVVDHIQPVTDRPDLRLTWSNLQSLCNDHHNGLKRRLEAHAREMGQIDLLPEWCADPASRPKRLRR